MRYRSAQQIVRDANLIKLQRPPVGPRPKQESLTDSNGSFGKAVRRKLREKASIAAAVFAVSGLALLGFLTVWGTVGTVAVAPETNTHVAPPPAAAVPQPTKDSPLQLEVAWNKPSENYKLGDVFEYRIIPKEVAYIYSFYLKNDRVSAFYPSAKQKSNLVDTKGVFIDSFNDEVVMLVDQNEKGLLVTVGVPVGSEDEKFELVHSNEYSTSSLIPDKLLLNISAETLFSRIQELREQNPRATVVIQKAPSAKRK